MACEDLFLPGFPSPWVSPGRATIARPPRFGLSLRRRVAGALCGGSQPGDGRGLLVGIPTSPGPSPPQPFCYAVLARPLSIQFVRGAFQSVVPMSATRAMYSALARALQQLMQVRQLSHAVHRKHGAVIYSSAAYAVGVLKICWLRPRHQPLHARARSTRCIALLFVCCCA